MIERRARQHELRDDILGQGESQQRRAAVVLRLGAHVGRGGDVAAVGGVAPRARGEGARDGARDGAGEAHERRVEGDRLAEASEVRLGAPSRGARTDGGHSDSVVKS